MQIIRTFPDATNDFLRFQIGRLETRREIFPIYKGHDCVGHEEGGLANVFRLLGFGSTLAAAEKMAAKAA